MWEKLGSAELRIGDALRVIEAASLATAEAYDLMAQLDQKPLEARKKVEAAHQHIQTSISVLHETALVLSEFLNKYGE